jgi:hypothetical protein
MSTQDIDRLPFHNATRRSKQIEESHETDRFAKKMNLCGNEKVQEMKD